MCRGNMKVKVKDTCVYFHDYDDCNDGGEVLIGCDKYKCINKMPKRIWRLENKSFWLFYKGRWRRIPNPT